MYSLDVIMECQSSYGHKHKFMAHSCARLTSFMSISCDPICCNDNFIIDRQFFG